MKTSVVVSLDFCGIHCWPNAPAEVSFLRNPHRHIFKVKAFFWENHDFKADQREREFILVKAGILRALRDEWHFNTTTQCFELGSTSCENIAKEILSNQGCYYCYRVEVFEDGENGAIVEL